MRFEVSETISGCNAELAVSTLRSQLQTVSGSVSGNGPSVIAKRIEATFGSINRSDTTSFTIRVNGSKALIVADVHYRPSFMFWVFFLIGLFTGVGWLLPIVFYLIQKSTVRSAILGVLQRVKAECEFYAAPLTP